jgi:hypothetical protein
MKFLIIAFALMLAPAAAQSPEPLEQRHPLWALGPQFLLPVYRQDEETIRKAMELLATQRGYALPVFKHPRAKLLQLGRLREDQEVLDRIPYTLRKIDAAFDRGFAFWDHNQYIARRRECRSTLDATWCRRQAFLPHAWLGDTRRTRKAILHRTAKTTFGGHLIFTRLLYHDKDGRPWAVVPLSAPPMYQLGLAVSRDRYSFETKYCNPALQDMDEEVAKEYCIAMNTIHLIADARAVSLFERSFRGAGAIDPGGTGWAGGARR